MRSFLGIDQIKHRISSCLPTILPRPEHIQMRLSEVTIPLFSEMKGILFTNLGEAFKRLTISSILFKIGAVLQNRG